MNSNDHAGLLRASKLLLRLLRVGNKSVPPLKAQIGVVENRHSQKLILRMSNKKVTPLDLFVLLSTQLGTSVGHLDVQLFGALDDVLTLAGGDIVSNFGTVLAVVHKKDLEFIDVRNEKFVETVWHNVPGGLVGTVTNLGHLDFTLETTTHARVNTAGLPP